MNQSVAQQSASSLQNNPTSERSGTPLMASSTNDAILVERMRFIHTNWFTGTIGNFVGGLFIAAVLWKFVQIPTNTYGGRCC